jgi:hypothetical protein
MLACLSSFPPSEILFKYLFKYIIDFSDDDIKNACKEKLLDYHDCNTKTARLYPQCLLEWQSNLQTSRMALNVNCSDSTHALAQISSSWSTATIFARDTLFNWKNIQNDELNGWSVSVKCFEDNKIYDLMGDEFVFDMLSALEKPPLLLADRPELFYSAIDTSQFQRNNNKNRFSKNNKQNDRKKEYLQLNHVQVSKTKISKNVKSKQKHTRKLKK